MYYVLFNLRDIEGENKGKTAISRDTRFNNLRFMESFVQNESIRVYTTAEANRDGLLEFYVGFDVDKFNLYEIKLIVLKLKNEYANRYQVAIRSLGYKRDYKSGKRIEIPNLMTPSIKEEQNREDFVLSYIENDNEWVSIHPRIRRELHHSHEYKRLDSIQESSLEICIQMLLSKVEDLTNY